MSDPTAFRALPDLALRTLGGAVIWANDEFFAERENLIAPGPSTYSPATFGHKGQVYDGWETRRRRSAGVDEAIVRLGAPGIVHGVVVDTAWFRGNYPPQISVEAAEVPGHPSVEQVRAAQWSTLVPVSPVGGDKENLFEVEPGTRVTHVKLTMHPDGGVARLRVHGIARPDVAYLDAGPVDLVAIENGGRVTDCSNMFYSSPQNLLLPGVARSMGDGWETARRRDGGNDWVEIALAAEGTPTLIEIDTSYFLGNAPGEARLTGRTGDGRTVEIVPRTAIHPDTRHRFVVGDIPAVTALRVDVYPDGGMARVRFWGSLTDAGRASLAS